MPVLKSPACGKPQAALLLCALRRGNPGYESAWRVTLASGWNLQNLIDLIPPSPPPRFSFILWDGASRNVR